MARQKDKLAMAKRTSPRKKKKHKIKQWKHRDNGLKPNVRMARLSREVYVVSCQYNQSRR